MSTEAALVFTAVLAGRFVIPLFIPLFPLPAIIAALVLDGVDQTIFQTMGFDPPGYQGYDKAMDVYYLSIAYLSTLRNWTSPGAVAVGRALFFYRLVGVVAFELTDWRPLLMIFPNTFEYFFIAYEIIRLRHDPVRFSTRFWVVVAAAIWIFVKLPQEYWIHIAQLDVTDEIAAHPDVALLIAVIAVVLAAVAYVVLRSRVPAPDHDWRIAADPLPAAIDTRAKRDRWTAEHARIRSEATVEKVVLIGLVCIIYAQVLPSLSVSPPAVFTGTAALVVVNVAVGLAVVRRSGSVESVLLAFAARLVANTALVIVARALPGPVGRGVPLGSSLFFVALLSLIMLVDDRFRPVSAVRAAEHDAERAAVAAQA
jgi:hypothetical protein